MRVVVGNALEFHSEELGFDSRVLAPFSDINNYEN